MHVFVKLAVLEELFVGAFIGDFPLVDDEDLIGVLDG